MKKIHKPDGYFLLDHDGDIRIFASWNGGYLDGDQWRISSAAKLDWEDEETLKFLTASNSHYYLRKGTEGRITAFNHGVLEDALAAGLRIIREEPCQFTDTTAETAESNKPTK